MAVIDKKDFDNIDSLQKILKSKKLGSIKIKKGEYEIEISSYSQSTTKSEVISQKKQKDIISNVLNEEKINKENIVSSPMVGLIYLSPEPTKPAFIKEGQHVKQGDILMLIEAMKTFNEIKAPKSGIIKKIVALNSQPVEFGETLVIFE